MKPRAAVASARERGLTHTLTGVQLDFPKEEQMIPANES